MFALIAAIVIGQATAQAPPPVPDARQLRVAPPKVLAEVDTVKVQGSPVGLAWNADGTLYLRVTQGKGKTRHYQIATVPALSVGQTDQAPAWAATYWTWKSGTVAPGDPTLKIEVEQRSERTKSINVPGAGGLAGMNAGAYNGDDTVGEGVGASEAAFAAFSAVQSGIVTMRFKGQVVGEWTNEPPQPGMQYGWAPAPMGVLAYVDVNKRLALVGRDGHKVLVPGATNVLLPAWSDDGTRIVYLQKKSAHLYLLMIAGLR
jgi:hypothetical protein